MADFHTGRAWIELDMGALAHNVSRLRSLLPAGCRLLHALSLPGRVAPLSAARAIHDTVLTILQEESIL